MQKIAEKFGRRHNFPSGGKIFPSIVIFLIIFFMIPSMCFSGESFSYQGPTSGKAMRITPSSVTIGLRESVTFSVSGGTKPITFTLSNRSYGTISNSGVFTAATTPTSGASLNVIAQDQRKEKVEASVEIVADKVEVNPSFVTLEKGESYTFAATGGTGSYTWKVSDSSYGSIIAATGVFTASSKTGTTNITVTDSASSTGSAKVEVVEAVVKVNPSFVTLEKGGSDTFVATGGTGSYSWKVSDSSYGSIVAATGVFTASSKIGTTNITVTDSASSKGSAEVEVVEAVIVVKPKNLTITKGGTYTFTATGGTGTYYWSTSDSTRGNIVYNTGIFSTTSTEGTLTINVKDSSGNTGSATVTIIGTSITVSPSSITIARGDTQKFSATGGTGTYYWTVSNQSLGNIDNAGLFTAKATGTLTVTATDSAGNTGGATVTITATSLTVSPATITVGRGNTQQFAATGGTGTYYWAVSDQTIGTISASGLFTSRGTLGTTTVTASDSAGNTGTASVTVATSTLNVSPATVTLGRRQTQQFTSTGGTGTIYWSASDRTIGSVSATGLLTAKTTLGATNVTATDSLGNSGFATATVVATVLDISPPSWFVSNSVGAAGASTTNVFSVSGGSGSYYWSISNNTPTNSYASPTNFKVSTPNTSATNTVTVTIPASNLGSKALTVLVQDTYGDSGTASITVEAAP
jgi:hypothetical protein